mmetsp:Transcript_61562/g.190698  ORF Transcript_61562/g.190698 Transcript_61562/m.190698 type:complete len:251 (+) Transcript_61562:531-1283(+)
MNKANIIMNKNKTSMDQNRDWALRAMVLISTRSDVKRCKVLITRTARTTRMIRTMYMKEMFWRPLLLTIERTYASKRVRITINISIQLKAFKKKWRKFTYSLITSSTKNMALNTWESKPKAMWELGCTNLPASCEGASASSCTNMTTVFKMMKKPIKESKAGCCIMAPRQWRSDVVVTFCSRRLSISFETNLFFSGEGEALGKNHVGLLGMADLASCPSRLEPVKHLASCVEGSLLGNSDTAADLASLDV